jgi:rapamycin-insensitive companion of mTOR
LTGIQIELWTVKTPTSDDRLIPLTDPREIELMTAIYNLSNTVIANTASRTLARMKLKPEYKDVFRSPTMLYRAIHIISRSKYKQPVRRYVLDLFDLQLNADTVTQLVSCEKQMHVHVVNGNGAAKLSRQTNPRVFSVIDMQVMHGDGMEGGDSDDDDAPAPLPLPRRMVRSLRPVSRIVGFAE